MIIFVIWICFNYKNCFSKLERKKLETSEHSNILNEGIDPGSIGSDYEFYRLKSFIFFSLLYFILCFLDGSRWNRDLNCVFFLQENGEVCGSDSRTYSSECQLRAKACKDQTELTVLYKGNCGTILFFSFYRIVYVCVFKLFW